MPIQRSPQLPHPLPSGVPRRPQPSGRNQLALVVLGVLRRNALAGGYPLSTFDIWDATKDAMAPETVDIGIVENVVQALLGLDLVRAAATNGTLVTGSTPLWEASTGWTRDMLDGGHGGGHDGGTRAGDGEGSRGFPEVLAHPILFALQRDDLDQLLEQILPE